MGFEGFKDFDDVRVLAQLQNTNFSLLQLEFLQRHISLLDDLDSNILSSLLVDRKFNITEFAFAQFLAQSVEFVDIPVICNLDDLVHPILSIFLAFAVVDTNLVNWENDLEREKLDWNGIFFSICSRFQELRVVCLHEGSNEAVHCPRLLITQRFVAVQLGVNH